jgi:GT2 family glycosyltransferase/tetratricopeptide (TPR) repeat protein
VHPVLDELRFPPELLSRQRAFKEGILHYQQLWLHFRAQKPGVLDGTTEFSRRLLAALDRGCAPVLARATAFPTLAELAHFAALPLDDHYFAEGYKTISGAPDREFIRTKGFARALGEQGVLWPHAANLQLNSKAASEFFSYAKAMLLCQPGQDNGGQLPPVTVIVQASNAPNLRACLERLLKHSSGGVACDIFVLVPEGDKSFAPVTAEFTGSLHRLSVFARPSSQSLTQQLNQAADSAFAPLLWLVDDSVQPAVGWDQKIPALCRPETGAVLTTTDAGSLLIRKSAWVEALGFKEKLSGVAASWHLLLALREIGWQIEKHFEVVQGAAARPLSTEDRRVLTRQFSDFENSVAEITGQKPLALASANGANGQLVSIVILVLNQLEHTKACLESIAAHTPTPHEVIIVDNGSTDGTPEFLKTWQAGHANCTVIRNESNRGFAGGNNQGLAVARGEYVLWLNNDTVVTPGWLDAMLAVSARHPETGLVGPMSNRVSGPQFVREAVYSNLTEMPAYAAQFTQANAGQSFEVVRAVGFCLLCTRAVVAQIGALDETFGSGNFEDDDYCLRTQLAGFRIRIARDSFVHHTGSQTFAGEKIDYRSSMLRNWEIFRTKWELPASASLEKGYPIPQRLPGKLSLLLPLPKLASTHVQAGNRWTEKPKRVIAPVTLKPAPVAGIGRLDEARELFARKEFADAWTATLTALARRPFHPEAYLLLAEIALAVGDGASAKACAQRAKEYAPAWTPVRQFLGKPLKGNTRPEWLDVMSFAAKPPRLSVCLIVKNEERFLAQCLKSVQGLAQQLVVVDTGSTDRTVEIAREFGAEIHSFAWTHDFAAARNAALEHANGDWILMLDADEELLADQHARLRHDMKLAEVIATRLPLTNVGQEAEGHSYVPRLFRNAPGVYFHGRIHEQVFASLLGQAKQWGLKTALGTAQIRHHGYTKEMVVERNKVERNLKLLQQAIEENPADVNLTMNWGLELVKSGNLSEGIEKYRTAFDLMSQQPAGEVVPELREVLLTQFTSHLYKLREHAEVVSVLTSPLAKQTGLTASLHFSLGLSQFELKNYREAAEQMRQCWAKHKQLALTPINLDTLTAAPLHCLALSLAKLGDHPGAEKAFQAALLEKGRVEESRLDYARFLWQNDRPVEALERLTELVGQSNQILAAWKLGGEIALAKPDFLEFACDWTAEAARAMPENPVLALQRGEALLLAGRMAEAAPVWEQLWRSEPQPRSQAALILCELLADKPLSAPTSDETEPATSLALIDWYQKLIAVRALLVTNEINQRLATLLPALPTAARMLEAALSEVVAATPASEGQS